MSYRNHDNPNVHEKILMAIEDEAIYTHEQILKELLCWLGTAILDDFAATCFGNVGLFEEIED